MPDLPPDPAVLMAAEAERDDLRRQLAEVQDRLAASQIEDLDKQRATNDDLRRQLDEVREQLQGAGVGWHEALDDADLARRDADALHDELVDLRRQVADLKQRGREADALTNDLLRQVAAVRTAADKRPYSDAWYAIRAALDTPAQQEQT